MLEKEKEYKKTKPLEEWIREHLSFSEYVALHSLMSKEINKIFKDVSENKHYDS